jgi:sarcosine oxidase, subunit alpha
MENFRVFKGVERGRQFEIEVDGEKIVAFEGETVAAALVAAGKRVFNHSAKMKEKRSMYCGIGLCYGCLMVIDGVPNTRSCRTLAKPGMRVEIQSGLQREEVGN